MNTYELILVNHRNINYAHKYSYTNSKYEGIKYNFKKNPANGRQSISRPMRIEAPIPKNPDSKAKFAEKRKEKKLPGDFAPFVSKSFQI